ncbi:hypothetical protein NJT12_04830 [Flavobacterium sp. AC]|uniref:Uncharacterized protein n=1 Tax=Flavobacterium azizsancarii TaxID=2961580 RepID=A0ABT4W8R6_9FLAO|nr:hypothetical protein [Flavobacterium azizsancarii]MDA6068941.1 hypothetical protein [Flavobacterium azizsancarii]
MAKSNKIEKKIIKFDNPEIESDIDFTDESLFDDLTDKSRPKPLEESQFIELPETAPEIKEDDFIIKESNLVEVEGIGDIIHIVTKAIGIEQCDDCKKRQKLLNQMFPFIKQAKKMTDDNIIFIKRIKSSSVIGSADRQTLFELYNYILTAKLVACACPGVILSMLDKLWNIYLADYSKNPDEK